MKNTLTAMLAMLSIQTAFASDFETAYIHDLAAFYPALKTNTQNIWPGFQISKHPALIYFPSSDEIYAFDFTPKNSAWQQQTISGLPVSYLPKDDIGLTAFITTRSEKQPYFIADDQSTLVSESFQIFSDRVKNFKFNTMALLITYYISYELSDSPYAQSKLDLIKKHVVYSGFRQADNLTLLYLENQLIKSYLATSDPELLKDYIALNETRNKLIDPQTAQFEQTMAPFVFNYFSIKGLTKNEAEYAQLTQQTLEKDSPAFDPPDALTLREGFYGALLEYAAAGVDLGLDRLNPAWKEAVESQNTAPDAILQQFFHLSDSEIQTRLATVKRELGYDVLNQQIKAILDPYTTKINDLQKSYQADSGVELIISLPDSEYINIAGHQENGASYEVDSDTTVNSGGDLDLTINKLAFSLTIKNMSILYHDHADSEQNLSMKLYPAAMLNIDGVKITIEKFIAAGKTISLHQLTITNGDTTIDIKDLNTELSLESKDGKLQLSLATSTPAPASVTLLTQQIKSSAKLNKIGYNMR